MSVQRIALVTGASRGIGKAILMRLASMGHSVVGTATSESGAESISKALNEAGFTGKGMVLDVCDPESIQSLIAGVQDAFGAPHILVNNAGITRDNLFLRMKEDQWDAVINANLSAVFKMTKSVMRGMFKAKWGRVINITSVVGTSGNPGQANYCAAKAGVVGFTKSVAIEMAGAGVTVNAVAPGFIDTDMTKALTEAQREAILSQIPMKAMGAPEDIASIVGFLASDDSRYITGQTIHVNGGLCMV